MPVNPDSRIPVWVNDFSPAFYISITDKENWSFTNYATDSAQLASVKNYFQQLGNQMNSYRLFRNRYNSFVNLVGSVYQYFLTTRNFSAPPIPNESVLNVDSIFSFGNFISETLTRPVNFYNDLVETPPMSGIWESARLQDSVTYIQNTAVSDEDSNINTIVNILSPISMNVINKAMFEEITAPTNPMGKRDVGIFVFNTLNYKKAVNTLNISPYELPSYITP